MNAILLVGAREFRQITSTRGFWVLMLLVPIILAVTQIGGRLVRPPPNVAYIAIDAGGEYAQAVERRLELSHQRDVLGDLAGYVERWKLGDVAPSAPWAHGQGGFSDAEVEAFLAQGGAEKAVELLAPRLPSEAPKFDIPKASFVRVAAPPDVAALTNPDALGRALAPLLEENVETAQGKLRVELAIYIPPDFGPSQPARIWTSGRPDQLLINAIRTELTRVMKDKAIEASGLAPDAYARIEATSAPLLVSAPPQGGAREQMRIRSLLPLGVSYLLLMTVLTTGGLMLQGVLEERSNKLLESVLACISPSELMYGKLFGLGCVGLTIMLTWIVFGVGAAFMVQGAVADILRPSLASFDQPWIAPALLFYFISGYLIISMIYLAVGALSSSLQDAQAYLMPLIFIITLPIVFMMISTIQDPNGLLPRILSWIPIYTPFAMLGRLGGGVSLSEVLGTGALLAVFVIFEMWALGRLFQDSILRTGQPPALAVIARNLFRRRTKPA